MIPQIGSRTLNPSSHSSFPTHWLSSLLFCLSVVANLNVAAGADQLLAGTAKRDITDYQAGPVNDPLFVKALVMTSSSTTAVIVTVDAVAIGEIGRIDHTFLPSVRQQIEKDLKIPGINIVVNASHCHGIVLPDITQKTVQAIKEAWNRREPVRVGCGVGFENRIMENRRLRLKNGDEIDVRHAYSLPPDVEVAGVGPIDPQIGILRLDRLNGDPLALVYQFACHPIQGIPGGGNTADLVGFASKVIEENLGLANPPDTLGNPSNENRTSQPKKPGILAFFLQGCGGDINPIDYKDVHHPRNAEILGNRLGLSTLKAARQIQCTESKDLIILSEKINLPRGDRDERIRSLKAERQRQVASLRGTSLNLKNFMVLSSKYKLSPEYPSANAHRYLQEEAMGTHHLQSLDSENRKNIAAYLRNVRTMENITRLNTNLNLLEKHQGSLIASGKRVIEVELSAIRIGEFRLVTFPGELTVQLGLNFKKNSKSPNAFLSGYTNGYIYYAPTAAQLRNPGNAQEDCDSVLSPQWESIFEKKSIELLQRLN